ncbi:hypothetical protein B7463_g12370, partial [Scytalidium lignicola]
MSTAYTYGYEPLQDPCQQIRLLTLNSSLDNGSVLTGSLSVHTIPPRNASRTTRLSKHIRLPGYFAVSYVWGTAPDRNPTHEIILNNRRFSIAANLHAALQFYRASYVTTYRFWVDAICINQANDQEKSAQIPLMRDIYHFAISVLAWLGGETAGTLRVAECFGNLTQISLDRKLEQATTKLGKLATENGNQGRKKQPLGKRIRTESEKLLTKGAIKGGLATLRGLQIGFDLWVNALSDDVENHKPQQELGVWVNLEEIKSWSPDKRQLKLVEGEDLVEMAKLLDHELFARTKYFSRMWTLQEICVAPRGNADFFGLDISDIACSLYYIQRTYGYSIPHMEQFNILLEINERFNIGRRESLRVLLALSANRESANPKDRIYALLGLMRDKLNPLLQPDYTKSVAEIYANATRHLIYSEKCLDVICGHRVKGKFSELASWVPDFRYFAFETGALIQASGENIIYHASGDEPYALPEDPFQLVPEYSSLKVTGIPLGTVFTVSDVSATNEDSETEGFMLSEAQWSKMLIQAREWRPEELAAIKLVSDLAGKYADFYQDSHQEELWANKAVALQTLRTSTAGVHELGENALDIFLKYFLTLLCGRITTTSRCKADELLQHLLRMCVPDQDGIELLKKLCSSLDSGTQGRHLIISEAMEIGSGPEDVREGDQIYVLTGCSVPVILRKAERDNEFQLVGECYLQSVMDGEALRMRDEGKATAHDLMLI